jgi:hypothetical protein
MRAGARRAAIALALVAVIGGVVVVLLTSGGSPEPSNSSSTTAPVVPTRHGPSPPWGFAGNWLDYCYQRLDRAPGYVDAAVPDAQPCPAADTRLTGADQIELTGRAGATVDRLEALWGAIEPSPPEPVSGGTGVTHTFNWGPLSQRYRAMVDSGIRPIVVAFGTPIWARQPGWDRPGTCPNAGGNACAYPPSGRRLADWQSFLEALMRRYPQMRALEVWNEPNSGRFFAPHPTPALYAGMLRAAASAAKATGFRAPVITAGLAPPSPFNQGNAPRVAPAHFLTRIYELAGKGSFDGIGVHPYPARPPWIRRMNANLEQVRRVRDRFHDEGTPLWITEVGIGGTPRPATADSVSLTRQGRILVRMYRSIQNTDVRSFIIYTLRDLRAGGARFEPFGVVRASLQPKPSYCDLARQLGRTNAC